MALGTLLLLSLSLLACGDKEGDGDGGAGDGGADGGGGDGGGGGGTDQDGDGHDSLATGGDDCDDTNAGVHPDMEESCDGRDNNCDDVIDEGFDVDLDSYLDAAACDEGTDCDDDSAQVHPGATEIPYDGIDQDCLDGDLLDVDGDGHDALESGGDDCDDLDNDVHPGALETPYDGIDQDCAGGDLLDADEDGYDSIDHGGDDCNDANSSIHPDAAEVPYDRVDQDCVDGDLDDLDRDGYVSDLVDGPDCDDEDEDINPDGVETPYDGVDQDCVGGDLDDVDGDGWVAIAAGGDDCNDNDESIHPGAVDTIGDDVDSNCDGSDAGGALALDDLEPSIWGATGSQDYMGMSVALCDLDDDGKDDLLVSAPLSAGYHGQIGIFYGLSAASWSRGMSMSDADAVIDATGYFMGFGLSCADLDGDGLQDIVTGRGEIAYTSTYTSLFELLVWYGDGTGFSAGARDSTADATLTFELGVTRGASNIYDRTFSTGDVDGDGAHEILVNMEQGYNADGTTQNGDNSLWILPGTEYSGDLDLESEIAVKLFFDSDSLLHVTQVTEDLDGDGAPELFLGQAGWDGDAGSTSYEGLLAVLDEPSGTSSGIADAAWASIEGAANEAFGYGGTFADIDGDGSLDAVVSAYYDSTAATYAGGLFLFEDLATLLDGTELARDDVYSGHLWGEDEGTVMGARVWSVGDMDGDGYQEVLAGQYANTGPGRYYLVDGGALSTTDTVTVGSMLIFDGTELTDSAGDVAAVGDIDGDGVPDLVLSAYSYLSTSGSTSYYSGRVYIAFGADLGF